MARRNEEESGERAADGEKKGVKTGMGRGMGSVDPREWKSGEIKASF